MLALKAGNPFIFRHHHELLNRLSTHLPLPIYDTRRPGQGFWSLSIIFFAYIHSLEPGLGLCDRSKNNVLSPEDLHPNSSILGLWRKYLCSWWSVKGFCNEEIVLCYPGVLVYFSCCCDNILGQKQLEKQRIYFNSQFIAGSEVKEAGIWSSESCCIHNQKTEEWTCLLTFSLLSPFYTAWVLLPKNCPTCKTSVCSKC